MTINFSVNLPSKASQQNRLRKEYQSAEKDVTIDSFIIKL